MHAFPFASTLRADKPLAVTLSFVALFGAAELAAVAYYYAARTHAAYKVAQPVTQTAPSALPTADEPAVAAAESLAEPQAAATQAPVSMGDRLLRQARKLRERGDTTTALARLQEAVQNEPKNASVLSEMAMIYESIQLFDRSNETWRRVQELGPAAGPLYELADMKLKIGVPAVASTPGNTAAALSFGADGIPEGSTFGITEVTPTQTNDPEAEMHLMLRVAVKKRADAQIDYTKVKIQVFFYDTADNNQRVVLTDADVSYEWLTPNHNWQEANPEVLAVTYLRPKKDAISSDAALTAAAAAVTPPAPGKRSRSNKPPPPDSVEASPRKYLGYIVRVYYKDQLQAVRAEPNRLLNLFPPPFTAPTQ